MYILQVKYCVPLCLWPAWLFSLRSGKMELTHWGRVTHICVSKLTIIGSDNGLSPGRRQAIIWTNAGILLIRPLGTNFNEMLIEILTFSFMKMRLKVSSVKWHPFCLGLNVLKQSYITLIIIGIKSGVVRCRKYMQMKVIPIPALKSMMFGHADENNRSINAVMLHELYGVSNHQQHNCLFKSFSGYMSFYDVSNHQHPNCLLNRFSG